MNLKDMLAKKKEKIQDGFTEVGQDGKETNLRLHMEMVDEEIPGFVENWVEEELKKLGFT